MKEVLLSQKISAKYKCKLTTKFMSQLMSPALTQPRTDLEQGQLMPASTKL